MPLDTAVVVDGVIGGDVYDEAPRAIVGVLEGTRVETTVRRCAGGIAVSLHDVVGGVEVEDYDVAVGGRDGSWTVGQSALADFNSVDCCESSGGEERD